MWLRTRPRCAISLGKSIAVAFSNSRSPREYEFATDTFQLVEVAVPRNLFRKILNLIDDLRPRPAPA